MKDRLRLPLISMALSAVCMGAVAQPADAAVRIDLPRAEPHPDARLLYCREYLATTLTAQSVGLGARIDKSPTDPTAPGAFLVRLTLDGKTLRVAHSAPRMTDQPHGLFGPEMVYRVVSDEPRNFVAWSDEDIEIGALMVVSMNRLASTMVLTTTYSHMPDQGHPFASSTFYRCDTNTP